MTKKLTVVVLVVLLAFGIGYFFSRQNDVAKPASQNTAPETSRPEPSSGATLDLSGQQLTNLPDSVLSRTDLTTLNLSNNQLTGLPAGISQLTNLQVLNIENNRLESLPPEISQLKNLRQILVNNNRLKTLQPELGKMTWLELLDVSGNDIPASEIAELKAKLTNTQIKP